MRVYDIQLYTSVLEEIVDRIGFLKIWNLCCIEYSDVDVRLRLNLELKNRLYLNKKYIGRRLNKKCLYFIVKYIVIVPYIIMIIIRDNCFFLRVFKNVMIIL